MKSAQVLFDAPGPRARRTILITNVVGTLLLVGVLVVTVLALADKGQLTAAKWEPFLTGDLWQYHLLPGLWATLGAAALSMVTSNVFGLLFGMGRLASNG
ncbi:MAG: amino acid ABC transporter permease, partial [bacterium]|nr:amino acid ABC transporter permease [bacterium]